MKAPKEIEEKIIQYQHLNDEAKKLFEEVVDWFNENGADEFGVSIEDIFIADKPSGQLQNGDEYCAQYPATDIGDDFCGRYYHQVEGSNKYVGYEYWC